MKFLRKYFTDAARPSRTTSKPDPSLLQVYCCGRIISNDPFITFSNQRLDRGFLPVHEIAKNLPELFNGTKGLHFIATNWFTDESAALSSLAHIEEVSRDYPGHEFIMLVANEVESYYASKVGIPTIMANKSIFEDESIWQIGEKRKHKKVFDAVYLARLDKFKRHYLAKNIESLNLVYAPTLTEEPKAALDRYRAELPNARFANHEKGKGEYIFMNSQDVCEQLNLAKVGLCLSPAEGIMRASIQYMLCGLPIVSTPSIGGRDRYYNNKFCKIVDADATAVSDAVYEMISQKHKPEEVRACILEQLEFDRYNFVLSAKKLAANHFNIPEPSISFDGLRGAYLHWPKLETIVEEWRKRDATSGAFTEK